MQRDYFQGRGLIAEKERDDRLGEAIEDLRMSDIARKAERVGRKAAEKYGDDLRTALRSIQAIAVVAQHEHVEQAAAPSGESARYLWLLWRMEQGQCP